MDPKVSFLSSLEALFSMPKEDTVGIKWRSEMVNLFEEFLIKTKKSLDSYEIKRSPVMITHVPDRKNIQNFAQILKYTLESIGFDVTMNSLTGGDAFMSQLQDQTYCIVLCTPSYARKIQEMPLVKSFLGNFGKKKKNALHPLLCEGGFVDTALKIVEKHYLIRNFLSLFEGDSFLKLSSFFKLILTYSSQDGLGVLPDILDLKEINEIKIQEEYQTNLKEFEDLQYQFAIDYRLQRRMIEVFNTHALRPHLNENTLPQMDGVQGFSSIIDDFLNSSANVSLHLCPTNGDTLLTGLALMNELIKRKNIRTLIIQCTEYHSMTANDFVRLELQKLQLKGIYEEVIKEKPLLILLNGYEKMETYENLYVNNKLNNWKSVKLLITCHTDFFQTRGYLKCFLPDISNRQVEKVIINKVPNFSTPFIDEVAKSLCIIPPNIATSQEKKIQLFLDPKKQAQYEELKIFLMNVYRTWISHGHLSQFKFQNPQIFISYAWEEKDELIRQQGHLSQIFHDLTTVGFPTWLDIERMTGNINDQMEDNITNSQIVFVICTPRYLARSQLETNVKREWDSIQEKALKDRNFQVFPIQFSQGDSFPRNLESLPNIDQTRCNFTEIDDSSNYLHCMTTPTEGLIPKLLINSPEKELIYQELYENFQKQLQLLVGKQLIVNQGQIDIQTYDMENRLKGYINSFGLVSETASLKSRFNLSERLNSFLNGNGNESKRVMVVLGRAGSGKSLFSLYSFKNLLKEWEECRSIPGRKKLPDWLPIYIKLAKHATDPNNVIKNSLQNQFQLSLEDIDDLKRGLGHQQRILFILDGYDELGSGQRPNLTQSLDEWPFAKMLITGRPEHFDKDHTPKDSLCLRTKEGDLKVESLDLVYVSPFVTEEIQTYISQHNHQDAHEQLQKMPGMMSLLDNPFLLTMVLQSLPQLLKMKVIEGTYTRTSIYQAFTKTWFLQETNGRELSMKDCQNFSEEFAFRLFKERTLSVSNIQEKQSLWEFFNHQDFQAPQDASPLMYSGGEYSFIHKSIYEFFVAKYLWKSLKNNDIFSSLWEERSLIEERSIVDFLAELYRSSHRENKDYPLFTLVELSKINKSLQNASSNAITVLNTAKVPFSEKDFQNVQIPGADLTGAILDHTNFKEANLSRVTFNGSWLHNTNFSNSLMNDTVFGELPSLLVDRDCSSCCFSPDGTFLGVALGKDVEIYSFPNQNLIFSLKGHTLSINIICFNHNGKLIASGGSDKTVKIWDTETGECQQTIEIHESSITGLDFSPNGQLIASSSSDCIKIWNLESREISLKFKKEYASYNFCNFSPDGRYIVFGHKKLIFLNIKTGEREKTWKTEGIQCVSFSPDGKLLCAGDENYNILVWKLKEGEQYRKFTGHTLYINSIRFTPDGRYIISGSKDQTIKMWNIETGEQEKTFEGHTKPVMCVSISPDGLCIASASWDKSVRFWNPQSEGLKKKATQGHTEYCTGVSFSPNGKLIVSCSWDNSLKLWDAETKMLEKTLLGHDFRVTCVNFSIDGKYLVSGSYDTSIRIWNVETGSLEKTMFGHYGIVSSVCFSHDGKYVISGSADETLRLWSIEEEREEVTLQSYLLEVYHVSLTQDGKYILSGSRDGTVKLWNFETRETYKDILKDIQDISFITMSPNSQWLALGRYKDIELWDVETSTHKKTFKGHTAFVCQLRFHPNGHQIISAGEDTTLRVWDNFGDEEEEEDTNICSKTVSIGSYASSLSFTQKNGDTFMISGHQDGSLSYWKITSSGLILQWSSSQNKLLAQRACLNNVQGLSNDQIILLKQRGAIDF